MWLQCRKTLSVQQYCPSHNWRYNARVLGLNDSEKAFRQAFRQAQETSIMQVEFAFAASSAAVVAPRNARSGCGAQAGMNAASNRTGMQLAFACTGVVEPVRLNGVTDLASEIAEHLGGPEEGVMTFDAFAVACRDVVNANVTRS
jgi:hypothetical protein